MNCKHFPFRPLRSLGLVAALGLAFAGSVFAHSDGHVLTQPWYGHAIPSSQPMPQMPGR